VLVLIDSISQLLSVPKYISSQHSNLIFVRIDFSLLVQRTPAEKLWEDGTIAEGKHYLNNISDTLRNRNDLH
jgi:hypothetical protein